MERLSGYFNVHIAYERLDKQRESTSNLRNELNGRDTA